MGGFLLPLTFSFARWKKNKHKLLSLLVVGWSSARSNFRHVDRSVPLCSLPRSCPLHGSPGTEVSSIHLAMEQSELNPFVWICCLQMGHGVGMGCQAGHALCIWNWWRPNFPTGSFRMVVYHWYIHLGSALMSFIGFDMLQMLWCLFWLRLFLLTFYVIWYSCKLALMWKDTVAYRFI